MTNLPEIPAEVARGYGSYPDAPRQRLHAIRAMIFDEADATETGPLTETLKWGQPSYLTNATRAGTTIRLAWSEKQPDRVQLLVHCNTSLVDSWRGRFPELAFDGNRALNLPLDAALPEPQLRQMIRMALSYHRRST